jgi:hypothetical protein
MYDQSWLCACSWCTGLSTRTRPRWLRCMSWACRGGVEEQCVDDASAVGQDSSVGIMICYGLDGPGIESHWRARFDATTQTDRGAHPTSYTLGTGSLAGGAQWPGCGADHPPPSSAKVKERVGTIHILPLQAFVACSRVNFLCICYIKQRVHFWKFKVGTFMCVPELLWQWRGAQFCIYTLGSKFASHNSDWSRILCNKIWRTLMKSVFLSIRWTIYSVMLSKLIPPESWFDL